MGGALIFFRIITVLRYRPENLVVLAIICHFFLICFLNLVFVRKWGKKRKRKNVAILIFDFCAVCVKKLTEGMASLSITGEEV